MKAKRSLASLFMLPFLLLISYLVLALSGAPPDSLADHTPLKEASMQSAPIETHTENVAVRFVTLPSAQITPTLAYTSYLPIVIKPEPPPQPQPAPKPKPMTARERREFAEVQAEQVVIVKLPDISIQSGWNFGIGFGLALAIGLPIIGCIFWFILGILGVSLGSLF